MRLDSYTYNSITLPLPGTGVRLGPLEGNLELCLVWKYHLDSAYVLADESTIDDLPQVLGAEIVLGVAVGVAGDRVQPGDRKLDFDKLVPVAESALERASNLRAGRC